MITIGIRTRVAAFAASLLLLLGLLVWAALASWDRVGQLRERLTLVNLESFRLADHFQKEVLSLNNLMMEVEIQKNESAWINFKDHGDQYYIYMERIIMKLIGYLLHQFLMIPV